MVLVLIGSRLFAPTFLLRLTTHETTSHMVPDTCCPPKADGSSSGFKYGLLHSPSELDLHEPALCFPGSVALIRVDAATMLA